MRREIWIVVAVLVAAVVATGIVLLRAPGGEATTTGTREIAVATPDGVRRMSAREVADALRENAELRERVRELEEAARADAPEPDEGVPMGTAEGEAPETEPGKAAGVPPSVARTDWDELGRVIATLVEAGAQGKDPADEPALMMKMAFLRAKLRAIASSLGLDDENEVFYHPLVTGPFMTGLSRALFPEMDAAAREALAARLADVVARERPRWESPLLPVEKQARDLELALLMIEPVRGELAPDQVESLLRVLGADRPGGYSISWMAMTDVEGLRASMGDVFASRFGLTGREAEVARGVAAAFVDRHLAARAELTRDFGEAKVAGAMGVARGADDRPVPMTALERTRIRARILRVQAEAEREVFDRVSPEARERMLGQDPSLWLVSLTE